MPDPEASLPPDAAAAVEASSEHRLQLDSVHTLVHCAGPRLLAIQAQFQAAGGKGALDRRGSLLLLFRQGGPAAGEVPQVWIESAGARWPLELLQASGGRASIGPMVALWCLPGGLAGSAGGGEQIHVRSGGLEAAAPLPARWRAQLVGPLPPPG